MLRAADPYSEMQMTWVPVLLYHRVMPRLAERDPVGNCISTAAFEDHLRWLARRGFRSMTVSELAMSAILGRGEHGLRFVITLDDGYEDNYLYALPLLKRYGFTATVFVVTDTIGGSNSFDAEIDVERTRMLSSGQIRALATSGIEIGSHTCSHPHSLPELPEVEMRWQIGRSRQVLEEIIGRPVRSFSYPRSRVSPRVEAAIADAGYHAACAGVGTRFTPYRLCRVTTGVSRGPILEAAIRWRWLKHTVARRAPTRNGIPTQAD